MKLTLITWACVATIVAARDNYQAYLWPLPQSSHWGKWDLPIDSSFHMIGPNQDVLNSAMQRYSTLLVKEHWQQVQEPFRQKPSKQQDHSTLKSLVIDVEDLKKPLGVDVDESYTLSVPLASRAHLKAATVWGALRGLETFSQLVQHDATKDDDDSDFNDDDDKNTLDGLVIANAPVTIRDKPRYTHRGIMIDTARNYLPVKDILRTLDAMAYSKMNVLHWHLTDSQSFPLALKNTPELAEKGAYVFQGKRLQYKKKDVNKILSYALERGIRVIPELDMPSHTAAWAPAFPDIVTCAGLYYLEPSNSWDTRLASEPGAGQLNPVKEKTYELVSQVLEEVTSMFPDDYYHGGADEPAGHCWDKDKEVVDYMKKHNKTHDDLLGDFLHREFKMLDKAGKTPIIWEDAVTSSNIQLPKNTVLQVWTKPLKAGIDAGHRVIASNANFWYLDCGQGGWGGNDTSYDEQVPPAIPDELQTVLDKYGLAGNYNPQNWLGPGGDWCSPYKSWQRVYAYDLTYNLTKEEEKSVLGGEVALWAEQVDQTVLDTRLWPRASAAAEVLWSGNKDDDGNKRAVGPAMPRMFDWRYRLVGRGIGAQALQPLWCGQNPHMCDATYPSVFL
ncbi:glycoside hydrolase superfamily [Gongronella butleri]|nr:glycoside hydrolase superfamily [Gongronella butleri]